MENDVVPVDNVDTLVESDQPSDLLSYIGGQQFTAAPAGLEVNQDGGGAPAEGETPPVAQDAASAATAQAQPAAVTTPPVGIDPVEKQRYEQAIADLQAQRDAERQRTLAIAAEARKKEDALFEASLKDMEPEAADLARAKRELEHHRQAAEFFKGQLQTVQQRQENDQQQTGKSLAAYKLAQHLGFNDDQRAALMTAETTTGMLAMARELAKVRGAQAAPAQRANPAALAAGGEAPPAAPPKRTPQRKGELIDMMRERNYVGVAIG